MEEKMKKEIKSSNKVALVFKIIIPLLIAVLSFAYFSNKVSSPDFHKNSIQVLDQKKVSIMELSAASATIATTVSLVLGDRAQPLATKLIDLTGYFLLILSAVILEKYLLTILGFASFKIILPIAMLLYILTIFIKNEGLKNVSIKLALFSLVLFLVIPTSIGVSNLIEKTYADDVKVVLDSTKKIAENAKEINSEALNEENNDIESVDDDKKNITKFINGIKSTINNVKENVGKIGNKIVEGTKDLFNTSTKILGNMVEAIAIMLVTTCVIPILILFFFIYIIKLFFNIDIMGKVKK